MTLKRSWTSTRPPPSRLHGSSSSSSRRSALRLLSRPATHTGHCRHDGISSDAYSYNSQLLNDSASGIQALLDSNALSVNGNVYINATDNSTMEADTSDAVSTILPTAYSTNSSSTRSASASRTSPTSSGGMRKRQTTSTSSAVASAATSGTNYLGAVMAARNNTVGGLLPSSATPSPSQTSSGGGGPNTGLAMIVRSVFRSMLNGTLTPYPFRSSTPVRLAFDSLASSDLADHSHLPSHRSCHVHVPHCYPFGRHSRHSPPRAVWTSSRRGRTPWRQPQRRRSSSAVPSARSHPRHPRHLPRCQVWRANRRGSSRRR